MEENKDRKLAELAATILKKNVLYRIIFTLKPLRLYYNPADSEPTTRDIINEYGLLEARRGGNYRTALIFLRTLSEGIKLDLMPLVNEQEFVPSKEEFQAAFERGEKIQPVLTKVDLKT